MPDQKPEARCLNLSIYNKQLLVAWKRLDMILNSSLTLELKTFLFLNHRIKETFYDKNKQYAKYNCSTGKDLFFLN